MTVPQNVFADIPPNLPEELFETLIKQPGFHIERIVSQGHSSPEGFWYNQETDEWVLLLQGSARLEFDNQPAQDLVPGAYVLIPAHTRHRVAWTDPTQPSVWLAIHWQTEPREVQP